jgi:DNA modification methylase
MTKVIAAREGRRRKERRAEMELEAATYEPNRRNDLTGRLRLEDRPLGSLKLLDRPLVKSDAKRLAKAVKLANHCGWVPPPLINEAGEIIGEALNYEVARQLDLAELTCVVVTGDITTDEVRLISVALQEQAGTAEIDLDALQFNLIKIRDAGLPLELTGIDAPQLELIMAGQPELDPDLDKEPQPQAQVVSILGDLWLLGESRVLCADAAMPASYERLMEGKKAGASVGDPPFNIPIAGNVSGKGKVQHQDFVMGVGEWSEEEFLDFLISYLRASSQHVLDDAAIFAFMDWRSSHLVVTAGKAAGLTYKAKCIWSKGGGAMGTPWRSAFEEILVFTKGDKFRLDRVALGKHGRNRCNVWEYAGANRPGSSAGKALALHSTPKSVEMIADAIRDVTAPGEIVLDPFLGSGTTIMAAEAVDRIGYGLELDPKYVDVIVRRWQEYNQLDAVHAETGLTFSEIAEQRGGLD